MRSPKEISIEKKIFEQLNPESSAFKTAELLSSDSEIQLMQEYANTVSIVRLGYNDHGPVHMRTVTRNAVLMLNILHEAGIKTNLENENAGTLDDSMTAVILASFLHDLGMTIGRQDHELYSMTLATPIIDRILEKVYPDELGKRVIIRSLAMEGIIGHMAARRIHSLEAGLILIADGCDMEKGRARIPMVLNTEPKVGDIHKYSANSIEKVKITAGDPKPVRISIDMSSDVGFFQIEEVLLPKVNMSPVKPYIEIMASVQGGESKKYL
ncbi:phosphohydrolase [Treponema zuelzerae]|uniref:Phosphohydrolase n=1 Tax=Teretinema zuelzerae TaxID=156 RepID=A0AAE3EFL0_9SPIR|nr:phosphohydrolase [Teretinema zuelzerae]MCD1653930.1 phosphohydrolase [Teretinema zuelzerae]HPO02540.1 phosphohydrolase [Treponemataceae bacterium]